MKNENYIHHSSYLRNSIAYDHGFWYTCVKWYYLQVFFSFFKMWFSRLLGGGKSAKNGQKWQKILSVALHISVNMHHVIVIYGTEA